jgi:2-oxoglutarate ferredoxin oxidoreductase subunit alpha
MNDDLLIGMAGSGGDGIVSAGESLMSAAALEGYHAIMTKSFGSQIRGGESSCRLRISTRPVASSGETLDVAVALNWPDFLKFGAQLPVGGRTVVIYDGKPDAPAAIPLAGVTPAETIAVPIAEMAKQAAGSERAKNTVVLGLLAGWFGVAREAIRAGMVKKFARKSRDVLDANERAFAAGLAFADAHPLKTGRVMSPADGAGARRLVVDGNEMCAAAAIAAGCEFFAGYPITPSSEIMQFLDREIWSYGGTMLQAEDEIAGIGAVVGASFAGKKAMTATSGPGMSLKTEMLGLASIAELPLVCVNVQRGGPSTGLPTKSEQADLFQAIFSGHGDTVRPVLAPVDVRDTFAMTIEAFNIAEEYQTPVILLADQEIAQRKEIVDPIDPTALPLVERRVPTPTELDDYQRFRMTESHVSPITRPGMPGGNYLASGIEHDEHGAPTASGEVHARMNAKRLAKLDPLTRRRDLFVVAGDADAPIALISWGSVAGVAMEALRTARAEGLHVKLLVPKLLYPVARETYREFFASAQAGLVIEQSHQGQLHRVIRMYVDVPDGVESLAKSGANPIVASEVVERVRQMALRLQRRQVPRVEPRE